MWTPKQLFTTQTFFFCSTGDEERMGGAILEGDTRNDDHLFLGTEGKEFPEWEVILWGLGHRGVVPDSDPLDRVYYPSLMHRNVSFNNRLGWTRYSPAGFGKDASGYLMTRPTLGSGLLSTETERRRLPSTSWLTFPTAALPLAKKAFQTSS